MDYVKEEGEEKAATTTTSVVVNWLELPEHLTSHIMNKLISIYDYVSFSAVCVQWQSIFLEKNLTKSIFLPSQVPLLMIPTPPLPPQDKKKKKNKYNNSKKKNNKKDTISCSFYRVTDGKIFNRLRLAMPRDRYVRGSGYGWLITVDEDEMCFSIQLMNPFYYPNYSSNKEIKLPTLVSHPLEEDDPEFVNYTHLRKAVLSADPLSNPKDFMVMAIFFGIMGLAFWKPGDAGWTPIETDYKLSLGGMFYDLIYYQGKFYALHCSGTVVVCNVEKRTMEIFARPPLPETITYKKYLVVSGGELFQVHRYVDDLSISKRFRVFKLERRSEQATATDDWVVVKDLCGRVFFVGDNSSMSISASDFPGCKPNRIYYTDDDIDSQWCYRDSPGYGPRDFGVFNVQNGSFDRHYPTDFELWPAPIWIEPTLMRRSITCSKQNVVKKPIV